MQLKLVSHNDQMTRLAFEGEITQHALQHDLDPLESIIGSTIYQRRALVNMEQASYVDSSGISWLLGAHKRFERNGGRLILHSIPPAVVQVLQLLKLNSLLHVAADEREALQRAGGEVVQ